MVDHGNTTRVIPELLKKGRKKPRKGLLRFLSNLKIGRFKIKFSILNTFYAESRKKKKRITDGNFNKTEIR